MSTDLPLSGWADKDGIEPPDLGLTSDTTSELRQAIERINDPDTRDSGRVLTTLEALEVLLAAQKQRWELYGRLHQVIELFRSGQLSAEAYSKLHGEITERIAALDGVIGKKK